MLSVKSRMSLWFTLMVLLMAAMVLVFVLVINANAITDDPAGRLVKVVQRNADRVEFDNGRVEWDDLKAYSRGVYCEIFDEDGNVCFGAWPENVDIELPFKSNVIRSQVVDGEEYLLYDCYVDMEFTGIWIRGMIASSDRSGLMRTILILTLSIVPGLLVLSIGGGWLIGWLSFRPMEKIISTADDISDGGDLSRRLALKRGPKEIRRLARVFDRMFERLEQSFTAESQFVSDASHELRTPITIILAQCDRSRRKDETKEDFTASINVIQEQASHMSELVQQLLGMTRMHHGTDKYPMRAGDLSGFVEMCGNEFVPEDDRGISFSENIQPGIELRFNAALISRVVHNLLQNAYKYGSDNGHVCLALKRTEDGAEISVTDDGIGIAAENLDKVWQRFWQADTSRSEAGSSGLGLAMVREIAQFHGGTATVESTLGKGSCFKVFLPE
jgi:signal transduction histidine kinase